MGLCHYCHNGLSHFMLFSDSFFGDQKLFHVVWNFHPWDVMTKKRCPRVKIQVDQPLEFSNYEFEPSKNNVLLSLRPMDENPRRHEQGLKV